MINDTVGDMITRVRNANLTKAQNVLIPRTKITTKIAQILQEEGFITSFTQLDDNSSLNISLKYKGRKAVPYITRLKRISKPGLRVYTNKKEIPKVLGGIGIAILSTSQGVMTDREARSKNIGGEILCYIW